MKTRFRDLLIIMVILTISTIGYFMFKNAYSKSVHDYAIVYYNDDEVAVVNFREKKISITDQKDALGYPILDETNQTITILGYEQNGERHEVVIKYDFKNHSMQITDEKSPNNVCSKDGVKTSGSIQCLPNRVSIVFRDFGKEVDFDGEI